MRRRASTFQSKCVPLFWSTRNANLVFDPFLSSSRSFKVDYFKIPPKKFKGVSVEDFVSDFLVPAFVAELPLTSSVPI